VVAALAGSLCETDGRADPGAAHPPAKIIAPRQMTHRALRSLRLPMLPWLIGINPCSRQPGNPALLIECERRRLRGPFAPRALPASRHLFESVPATVRD
jgi:hypothetical protein